MRRSQPRRDWGAARRKVEREGCCRACGYVSETLQAAHIVGREHDKAKYDSAKGVYLKTLWVSPYRIVPLCPACHGRYDPHTRGLDERLDLLPFLTDAEKDVAFGDCGFDAIAFLKRTTGDRYVPERGVS